MRLHNRMVRATYWNDPDLLQQPRELRWFYQGLWHLADDSACLEDSPVAFKVNLFPGPMDNDITPKILAGFRDVLVAMKKLVPYITNTKRCLYLTNFHRHQTITTPSPPGKDSVPLPPWITWQPGLTRGKSRYVLNDEILATMIQKLEPQQLDKPPGDAAGEYCAPVLPQATPPNQVTTEEPDTGLKEPKNQQLIAELVDIYRRIEGIEATKGDYAFMGALYNEYGYDKVILGLNQLSMAMAVEPKDKPLVYLKGIIKRQSTQSEGVMMSNEPRAAPDGRNRADGKSYGRNNGGNGGKKEAKGGQSKRRDYGSGILGQRALRDIPIVNEGDDGYDNC